MPRKESMKLRIVNRLFLKKKSQKNLDLKIKKKIKKKRVRNKLKNRNLDWKWLKKE